MIKPVSAATGLVTAVVTLGAAPQAFAQSNGISGEIGIGVVTRPEYFGSDTYGVGITGRGGLEALTLGPISIGTPGVARDTTGFNFSGAFGIVSERSSDDYAELQGLEDIDLSVELGLGASYEAEAYRVFTEVRYGVIGHGSVVGEIGADYILRPSRDWEISAGPRLYFGDDDYASTYFGVTTAEASASNFSAFNAEGGLLSAGFDLGVERQLNADWSVRGDLEITEFLNSAADSPIVQNGSTTQATFGITLSRRFSFGF